MSQKQVKRERKKRGASRLPKVLEDIPLPKNGGTFPVKTETNHPTQKIFFKVPGELAQQILDYIQLRPYAEVHGLIGSLMRCEKVKE